VEKDHTSLGFQGRCIAILVGILIVANPELRVLLILVDALGLELVILILAIQLRGWLPAIRVVLKSACSRKGLWCPLSLRSADSGTHL
jgi:ABC-type dipeptide/oligopeptide/nickel transport system permease subunit